ncbi:MAG: hypothetical protein QNK37_17300 [Acidobacteriota bacterium]|nr:hypothetical protein [Acidobacteriota bacterium]
MTATPTREIPRNIIRLWEEGAWPCFSPDGRMIVFTGGLSGTPYLSVIPTGGGKAEAVIPRSLYGNRPTWLEGKRIAFNVNQREIRVVDLADGKITPFLEHVPAGLPAFFHPCAYPDGKAVVVVGFREGPRGREGVLYRLAPDEDPSITALTRYPDVCAGRPGVSPDNRTVVFAGNAGGFRQAANQLWLVRPGEPARRLQGGPAHTAQGRAPRYSPDGRWIACVSTRPDPRPEKNTPKAVWLISADGKESHQITDHALNIAHVAFSPDQKHLAFGGFRCPLGLIDLPEYFYRKGG